MSRINFVRDDYKVFVAYNSYDGAGDESKELLTVAAFDGEAIILSNNKRSLSKINNMFEIEIFGINTASELWEIIKLMSARYNTTPKVLVQAYNDICYPVLDVVSDDILKRIVIVADFKYISEED